MKQRTVYMLNVLFFFIAVFLIWNSLPGDLKPAAYGRTGFNLFNFGNRPSYSAPQSSEPFFSTSETPKAAALPQNMEELVPYLKKVFPVENLEIGTYEHEDKGLYELYFIREAGDPSLVSDKLYHFTVRENVRTYITAAYEAVFAKNLPVAVVQVVINPYGNKGAPLYSIMLGKAIAEKMGKDNWVNKKYAQPIEFFNILQSSATTNRIDLNADIDTLNDTCYVLGQMAA